MDKKIDGAAKRVRGSITEALGKLTGDRLIEDKGALQKREAEAEMKTGELKASKAKKRPKVKIPRELS